MGSINANISTTCYHCPFATKSFPIASRESVYPWLHNVLVSTADLHAANDLAAITHQSGKRNETENHPAYSTVPSPFVTVSLPKTHPKTPTTTKRPFSSPRDIPSSPNFCKGPPNHPISRIILSIRTKHRNTPAKPSPPSPSQQQQPTMVSLAPFVLKRPWLVKALTPAANWYAGASGYRQLGLRYE